MDGDAVAFDGSKRNEGAGAGVILISPKSDKLCYVLQRDFEKPSNNEAEYEALIHGMKMAKECGADSLMIYGDSNLVVQQTMKECDAAIDNMIANRNMYNVMEGHFDGCELHHVGRTSNKEADTLANIGSMKLKVPPGVFLEKITKRSIKTTQPAALPTSAPGTAGTAASGYEASDSTVPPVEVFLIEPI